MKNILKTCLALVLVCALGVALLAGLNTVTAPMIEAGNAAEALAPLYAVMPEAKGFEELQLENVPATVTAVYRETSDQGYVLLLETYDGYVKDLPMDIAVAIDNEGKITATSVLAYNDTKDFGQDSYPASYVGQDSALADVELVAGVTFSSSAFKNAVSDGFTALIDNGLVSAGVKSDDQLLSELIAVVYPGIANASGVVQAEEADAAGSFTKILKANNDGGFAMIGTDGEQMLLAVVNADAIATVYDAEGNDVTVDHSAFAEEAAAYGEQNGKDLGTDATKRALKLLGDDTLELEPIALNGVYNSVVAAYSTTFNGESVYVFAARPYGYSNMPMDYCYVLNANGEIVAMTAKELILEKEYFTSYTLDVPSYKAGFEGLSADTFTGDEALVTGATFTTEATQVATRDVFAAFAALQENGGIA